MTGTELVPLSDGFNPEYDHRQLRLDPEAFAVVQTLASAGVVTSVSLDVSDVPLDRRRLIATYFGEMSRHLQWWVGDLLNDSEQRDGHEYAQLCADTGLSDGAIQSRQYVCRRVAIRRRRPGLPFSVHHAVAALDARAQERWLKLAEADGMSAAVLRYRIAEEEREQQGTLDVGTAGDRQPVPTVNKALLEEAGRAILRDARPADDTHFLVPAETIARLRAAFDEEE